MLAKKLRAAVAAFVVAVLLPVSAATAMPGRSELQSSDSGFVSAIENLGSSVWRVLSRVLAKYGVSMNPDGNH